MQVPLPVPRKTDHNFTSVNLEIKWSQNATRCTPTSSWNKCKIYSFYISLFQVASLAIFPTSKQTCQTKHLPNFCLLVDCHHLPTGSAKQYSTSLQHVSFSVGSATSCFVFLSPQGVKYFSQSHKIYKQAEYKQGGKTESCDLWTLIVQQAKSSID